MPSSQSVSASPAWESLLELHDTVRKKIGSRLSAVEDELRALDTLRSALSKPSQERLGSRQMTRKALLPSRKRARSSEEPLVGYLLKERVEHALTAAQLDEPFENAGLYATDANPIVQFAPLQKSHDELVHSELLRMFPPEPAKASPHTTKTLPQPAVERIESSMHAAGFTAKDYTLSAGEGEGPCLRMTAKNAGATSRELFSPSLLDSAYVGGLQRSLCGDPMALLGAMQTALLTRALQDLPPPIAQRVAPTLLPFAARHKRREIYLEEMFAQSRDCADPDLSENADVSWIKSLLCVRPAEAGAVPPEEAAHYAQVWCFLFRQLRVVSTVRHGYLPLLCKANVDVPTTPTDAE